MTCLTATSRDGQVDSGSEVSKTETKAEQDMESPAETGCPGTREGGVHSEGL